MATRSIDTLLPQEAMNEWTDKIRGLAVKEGTITVIGETGCSILVGEAVI